MGGADSYPVDGASLDGSQYAAAGPPGAECRTQ
jgi:hypothetical protein